MKKEWTKAIAFLSLLVMMLFGLSFGIDRLYSGNQNMVGNRAKNYVALGKEEKDTIDVLVLGDSETYTTISPMRFWDQQGVTCFVGGQHGQRLDEAYSMLEQGLKNQKPRLVMLETNMFFRKNKVSKAVMNRLEDISTKYFSIFVHHDIWKKIVRNNCAPVESYKGFQIKTKVASFDGNPNMKKCSKCKEIKQQSKDYIKKIVDTCKKNNIEVVFYSAPSPVNYDYKKHNAIEKIADELDVDYIDLNLKERQLGIDWQTDTLDKGDHLNIVGARKVSDYMIKYLGGKYDLPDHRGDENFKDWEKLSENYKKDEDQSVGRVMKNKTGSKDKV